MQIKFTTENIITTLPDAQNVRVGEIKTVHPDVGKHLIDAGVAIALKVEAPAKKKMASPSSASQADPASQQKTAQKRRGRPRKSSQSTTAGE